MKERSLQAPFFFALFFWDTEWNSSPAGQLPQSIVQAINLDSPPIPVGASLLAMAV
jgi:hypothetical protein